MPMFRSNQMKQVLRPGDRVRAHFQNKYGEKSSATDVGTVLQFTTSEAEIQFDDGAIQSMSKTWIAERVSAWDVELAPGDLVQAHYVSGKGRTQGTDAGVVLALLDGGRARVRFQDDVLQIIPLGWVESCTRLQPGDRVTAYFRINDGKGAKSGRTDQATILRVLPEDIHVVYDDCVEQSVPKTWVTQRPKAWSLTVEIGAVVEAHFEVGEEPRRSPCIELGTVIYGCLDGRVGVQFQETVKQQIPIGWIERIREWSVADRVQAHFKTGSGEKSTDTDVATILSVALLEVELYFDDGVQQSVPKTWIADRVRDWNVEVPELAVGDVVVAHFKRPGNHAQSAQTDRGIVVSMLPRGQVSVVFQDDVSQVIPKGWIETVVTRWSGQREKLAVAEEAELNDAPRFRRGVSASALPECVICMDARPNGVIVHGDTCHLCSCYECAKRLQQAGKTCPMCREPIATVCKLHGD